MKPTQSLKQQQTDLDPAFIDWLRKNFADADIKLLKRHSPYILQAFEQRFKEYNTDTEDGEV